MFDYFLTYAVEITQLKIKWRNYFTPLMGQYNNYVY